MAMFRQFRYNYPGPERLRKAYFYVQGLGVSCRNALDALVVSWAPSSSCFSSMSYLSYLRRRSKSGA